MCNRTRYPQFSNFSGMQSSFEMCLPITEFRLYKKQRKPHSLAIRTSFGPRNSRLCLVVWWESRLCNRMPSKDSDRSGPGLYDLRSKVRQWM